MQNVSDINLENLITGLRKRDHKILSEIYKQYYPLVLGYILNNGGDDSDAKDVFQETIIVLYKLSDREDFIIKQSIGAYLIGISKRIWLKQLRSKSIHEKYLNQADKDEFELHPSDKELEAEHELNLIRKHIVKLGKDCKDVLLWSADGVKNEEIASRLGYKSEKTVRTKKYKCKEALIGMIKQDPGFKPR